MASEIAGRVRPPSPRAAVAIGAAVLLLVVLYMGRGALGPFILGALLVYILDPVVGWLTRRGLRRGLAILIVYSLVIVVLVEGVTLLFGPLVRQVIDFLDDLPALLESIEAQLSELVLMFDQLQLPRILHDFIAAFIASLAAGGGGFDIGSLAPLYNGVAAALRNLLALAIVPIWAFYLLKDRDRLLIAMREGIPADWRDDAWSIMAISERVFGRWLRGQIVLCVAVGVATFVGLMALSLVDPIFGRFAVLLAVIAGILELVPIIGPIISMVPTLLLAATTGRIEAIIAVVVLYVIVQQLENQLLVPRIQGGAVEMHPAIVILALAIGAAIAGLLGAIFALPIAAAARDIVRYAFQRASGLPPSEATGYRPPPGAPALATAGATMTPAAAVIGPEVGGAQAPPVAAPAPDAGHAAGLATIAESLRRRSPMPELPDHYKVLQVDSEAEEEVIQAAYRRLAQKYHPDVAASEEAAARMSAINGAWAVLRDATARAAYDAERAAAARRAASHPPRRADEAARRATNRPPRYAAAHHAPAQANPRGDEPGLDGRSLVLRRWLRARLDASEWRGRTAARPSLGQRHHLRPLRRLVAGRDRATRPRVHRVARPDAHRSAVSRRDRRHPAGRRSASHGRRRSRATRPLPAPLITVGTRRRR